MPFRWFRREASPKVLDDATWHTAMQCLPVLAHLDADARRRLNDLAREFLRHCGWIPGLLAASNTSPAFRAAVRLYLTAGRAARHMTRMREGFRGIARR